MNELDANEWIALVQQDCEFPDVVECLERHGVTSSDSVWVGDSGTLSLSKAGVILHLRKPGTRQDVFVHAVEFAVSGDSGSFDGSLPHGIDSADSLMDITLKLHPAMLTQGGAPYSFDAVFPEHRLVIQMDGDDMLQSLLWVTTREFVPG